MTANTLIFFAVTALAVASPAFAQEADAAVTTPKLAAEEARPAAPVAENEKGLRLNFRGAPLEQVLNYMSDAAGFIINVLPGTDVKGKIDVWSNQPLTQDEAVQLLNTILHQNGLAAIRTGRTLSIISRDTAKTNKDVPVAVESDPKKIPRSDEMVTQIIPVKYVNAAALVQNLQPLLPEYAQTGLSANEAGNALLLTATQTDVRRMAEIVNALDQAISNVSEIKVFPLKFADAKTLVDAVKELFTPPAAQTQGGRGGGRGEFFQNIFGGGGGGGGGGPFGGGGRGGGFPNAGNSGGGTGARGNTSATAARVVAVADERSNSLIVAAAADAMPEIERLVREVDVEVDEVSEIRLFPLVNSDPNDLVDILSQLFPDPTTSNQQQGGRFGGFRGGFGGGFNRGQQQTAQSERATKQSRVLAVADARTSSLIVTAARDLMPEIEKMVRQLDANRRGRQRVYVYNLENADVTQVEQVVRDMFDRSNTSANNNQQSALQNRIQQNVQNQGLNTGGIGQGQGGGGGGNNLGAQFGR